MMLSAGCLQDFPPKAAVGLAVAYAGMNVKSGWLLPGLGCLWPYFVVLLW